MRYSELLEDRVKDNPDIKYSEIEAPVKKTKGEPKIGPAKREVDRVIALLSGNASGPYTRMAKRYDKVDRLIKILSAKKAEMNDAARAKILELFDAEDAVLTRVIETASLTITLTKNSTRTTTKFDADGCIKAITALVPELESEIMKLVEAYTKTSTIDVKPGVSIDTHTGNDAAAEIAKKLEEGFGDIAQYIKSVVQSIRQWASGYDRKLEQVRRMMS